MSSELNEETTKDLMIKLFPKSSNEPVQRIESHPSQRQYVRRRLNTTNKEEQNVESKVETNSLKKNKTLIAVVLAIISVIILSPYVLNKIDEIASNRGYTLFNSKEQPTLIFLGVLVVVLTIINRVVIGFI